MYLGSEEYRAFAALDLTYQALLPAARRLPESSPWLSMLCNCPAHSKYRAGISVSAGGAGRESKKHRCNAMGFHTKAACR